MSVMLATLCLNEMEHLPRLYLQHKDWPGLTKWVFVESADAVYAKTNPNMVNPSGLSVDGTSKYLQDLADVDSRVAYIPFGFSSNPDPAQGKVQSRQQYLLEAEECEPEIIVVLDADEFYTIEDQEKINNLMAWSDSDGMRLKQRHIWRPEALAEPLFTREVVGGYWNIAHCRVWRWSKGLRYHTNHNTPETPSGRLLSDNMAAMDRNPGSPQCIHMGFASAKKNRQAKHAYYVARGEGASDKRQMYVNCRKAFEDWKPGDKLPHGARVISYDGPIPEVFKNKVV